MGAYLEITASPRCPNKCLFCPQELFEQRYPHTGYLSLDEFRTAIGKIPEQSTVVFAGFTEPCMNQDVPDMILEAAARGHQVMLLTTLVGLNLADYERIRHINFAHFSVHVPDNQGTMFLAQSRYYDEVLRYVSENPPNGVFLFNHHRGQPREDVAQYAHGSFPLILHDRAGNLEGDLGAVKVYHHGNIQCGHNFLFQRPHGGGMMLPNGDVYLCCSDFGLQHRLGNLLADSWEEIMNCQEMKTVLSGLGRSESDILCRRCYLAKGG